MKLIPEGSLSDRELKSFVLAIKNNLTRFLWFY